jgi:hypothetical protein
MDVVATPGAFCHNSVSSAHKSYWTMSSKRKVSALLGQPTKGNEQSTQSHLCPNSLCKSHFQFFNQTLLIHLSKTLICSDSFSMNRTSSPVVLEAGNMNHSKHNKPSSKETIDDASLIEPDNDGWSVAASDDGSDKNVFDEPWACLKAWESTDDECTESGSDHR